MVERDDEEWKNAYGRDLSVEEIAELGLDAAMVARIDACLMDEADIQWRKMARVVGFTMVRLKEEDNLAVSDMFCAMRMRVLVADGRLEAQGDLYRMRFSEVRRPPLGEQSDTVLATVM